MKFHKNIVRAKNCNKIYQIKSTKRVGKRDVRINILKCNRILSFIHLN